MNNQKNISYQFLPFNFGQIDEDYLITNEGGEYYFLNKENFYKFVKSTLDDDAILYDLKSKNFIAFDDLSLSLNMLATKYRTRKSFLKHFTCLHMMVITLRCNHRCKYCQVSSKDKVDYKFDMSPETAEKILEHIFCSPSKNIKIEFQGGEPLLNWETLSKTVLLAEQMNKHYQKQLEFVVCTNLTLIDSEKLEFIKAHKIQISTSLDGPKIIHDKNRVYNTDKSSYDDFLKKLKLTRQTLGKDSASALVTITKDSLYHLKEVIDEYKDLGFSGIFLRSLNPYGDAIINKSEVGYENKEFLQAFEDALDYIIKLNLEGFYFPEYFTTLLLTRILTSFSTGFVDLQSPAGAGISGVIYDYNGDVYPADEGRMLARMGDKKILMGNVFKNSYKEIFTGSLLTEIVEKSCLDIMPGCSSCVFKSYCGADPIRNYLENNDLMGNRSISGFCQKHKGIFEIIFRKLKANDPKIIDVFWSWLTN
ncbi:MAG: Anaerobic sulfatase-maturating enzyme [Candidatus Anoxychlamydiales bacterium]|nr:Anaerobic sulfatase-maturating enzyme [Candidatus Anoxychlamydiales bacterium]